MLALVSSTIAAGSIDTCGWRKSKHVGIVLVPAQGDGFRLWTSIVWAQIEQGRFGMDGDVPESLNYKDLGDFRGGLAALAA
jgi:hypothetical protein